MQYNRPMNLLLTIFQTLKFGMSAELHWKHVQLMQAVKRHAALMRATECTTMQEIIVPG